MPEILKLFPDKNLNGQYDIWFKKDNSYYKRAHYCDMKEGGTLVLKTEGESKLFDYNQPIWKNYA